MDVRFSRHAKRRMNLYALKEDDILSIVTGNKSEWEIGERFIIIDHSMKKCELPIKIVGIKEEVGIVIITVYPLKQRSEDR